MLDGLDCEVLSVANGREALRLLARTSEIDLVPADFAMPEMTGVDLAKAISDGRPALPVMLVTAYENHVLLGEFSGTRILRKPYSEVELADMINAALS
jgi:CheY-like chemotaxis protein